MYYFCRYVSKISNITIPVPYLREMVLERKVKQELRKQRGEEDNETRRIRGL